MYDAYLHHLPAGGDCCSGKTSTISLRRRGRPSIKEGILPRKAAEGRKKSTSKNENDAVWEGGRSRTIFSNEEGKKGKKKKGEKRNILRQPFHSGIALARGRKRKYDFHVVLRRKRKRDHF